MEVTAKGRLLPSAMEVIIAMARATPEGRASKGPTDEARVGPILEPIPIDAVLQVGKRATDRAQALTVRAKPPARAPGVRIRQLVA